MTWTVPALLSRAFLATARRLEPLIDRLLQIRPVRQRLHAAAVQAWRNTDDPLVLCFGNINRSPLAAALARRRTGSVAHSSGFYPTTGRASPDRAILRAATYGVDLSRHRSTRVDQAALGRATAIFIFDLDNLARIALTRPEAIRRTYFVGALTDIGPVFIQDPHGADDTTMHAIQDRIVAAIEAGDTGRA